MRPKTFIFLLFFMLSAPSASAETCPELAKNVQFCVERSSECLAATQNANEVITCYQRFSKCALSILQVPRKKSKALSKDCTTLIAETEKDVKRAGDVRFQELIEEIVESIKSYVSPIISHFVKSNETLLEFENLRQSPVALITFLIRNSPIQDPLTKRTSELIGKVEKAVSSQVLSTPFDIWSGGIGGVIGKFYDRLWVTVFCRNSENQINQVSAKHSDCLDGKGDKQLCDNQLITDLMKIADSSTDNETCKLYALSVEASLKLVPRKSYGLRNPPLTEKDLVMDQITGRSYQNNQDGLLKLPEGQGHLYEKCASCKKQISACQNAKNSCNRDMTMNDEYCELNFAKCHNEIKTNDVECSNSLGQNTGLLHGLKSWLKDFPTSLIALIFTIYCWASEFKEWVIFFIYFGEFYKTIKGKFSPTPANSNDQRVDPAVNAQVPGLIQEGLPPGPVGNDRNDQLSEPEVNNTPGMTTIQLEPSTPPRNNMELVAESIEMTEFKHKGEAGPSDEDQGRPSGSSGPREFNGDSLNLGNLEPNDQPNRTLNEEEAIPFIDANNDNVQADSDDSAPATSSEVLDILNAEEAGISEDPAEVEADPNDASTPLLRRPIQ